MISSFVNWLVNVIETLGYPGVALSMFVESFFAPIPSEIILPFSGFVASKGTLNIYFVIIVATFAAYLGSLPFYIIGYLGEKEVYKFLEKYGKYLFITKENVKKGYDAFEKYGNVFVLTGRVIPIVRTLISFPAGVSKMNFGKFTIYTLVGTAIWSTVLILAGYFLGSQWENAAVYINRYEHVIIGLMGVSLLGYILYKVFNGSRKKSKKKRGKKN